MFFKGRGNLCSSTLEQLSIFIKKDKVVAISENTILGHSECYISEFFVYS